MEKVWRRVGLHSSRKKRDGSDTSQQAGGSAGVVPQEAEYQNIHTLRTADLIRQRLGEDKSTLRSSYIIRNGDNLVLVERRRRRRRRSGARASSGSRHATPPVEEVPRAEKRRPPARLKIFGIQWPLHSSDSRPSITRRFCRGRRSKEDNELYRSNSFKFERFERERPLDESASLLTGSQAALCADYSVPVDCVGAAGPAPRPSSFHEVSAPKVEFVEAYCAPRDTARRSPHRRRAAPRRSPASQYATNTRGYAREYPQRPEAFDFESARRRADYESARRTDFDLSRPGRRSPDSAPEGSLGSPPEPAPSAPPLHDLHSRHYNRSYYRSESSSEAPSSSVSEDEEELDAYDASGAAPSLHSPDSGRSHPTQPRRNPSPYYYGDLFRTPPEPGPPAPPAPRYRKSASLDAPHVAARPTLPKRFSVAEDGFRELERSSSSSSGSRAGWMPPRRRARDAPSCVCAAAADHVDEPHSSRSVFYVPAPLPRWPREMTAHRVYETAFDSKVARSHDDLDDFGRIGDQAGPLRGDRSTASASSSAFEAVERGDPDRKGRRKVTMKTDSVRRSKIPTIRQKRENEITATALSEEFEKVHLESEDRTASTSQLPICGFTPTPPATAPLPTKFQQCKDYMAMNSIKSAPNLPAQPAHPRLKDLRLPVKSLRARETPTSSDASLTEPHPPGGGGSAESDPGDRLRELDLEDDEDTTQSKDGIFLEIKGRPTSDSDTPESIRHRGPEGVGPILEFKGRPPAARPSRKYSSTDSMGTSSSGGSMESIGSGTSEERSTTSSPGRRASSCTLSSHSSDSAPPGPGARHKPLLHHPAKLHILSPISDKSSLEPASETSDHRNNSQKVSPEELDGPAATHVTEPIAIAKSKRRLPQNRNLLSLAFQHSQGETEMQGSDSGISIHSREGSDSRNTFLGFTKSKVEDKNGSQDLSDLPFDMPKLRRRRAVPAEAEDLRSLPFDMPKLRRKLRGQSLQLADYGGISQASSSQSMNEDKPRAKLTLNLEKPNGVAAGCSGMARGLNLNLGALAPPPRDLVDASVPLDRQGWYHGTISRVEAENALRDANEGAFLVRNSESTKHDYSLSLKSVRGFMHLRICRSAEGFSLGSASDASSTFPNVPALLRHYVAAQRLPVRGAEHMALATPLAAVML